jgi:hypothetical protein
MERMKASLVWATPQPEKTIALAMRRCYSTKPVEEIDTELNQKGVDYWKHLIELALRDKSLDVIEHFCMELVIEDLDEEEAGKIAGTFPFARFLKVAPGTWLLSMNARTLIEAWRLENGRELAAKVIKAMKEKGIGTTFISVAFAGE